jgi:hypothetical protein
VGSDTSHQRPRSSGTPNWESRPAQRGSTPLWTSLLLEGGETRAIREMPPKECRTSHDRIKPRRRTGIRGGPTLNPARSSSSELSSPLDLHLLLRPADVARMPGLEWRSDVQSCIWSSAHRLHRARNDSTACGRHQHRDLDNLAGDTRRRQHLEWLPIHGRVEAAARGPSSQLLATNCRRVKRVTQDSRPPSRPGRRRSDRRLPVTNRSLLPSIAVRGWAQPNDCQPAVDTLENRDAP